MPNSTLEQVAFNWSPDAVFVTDERGDITHANLQATVLTGYSLEELTSMSVDDLVPVEARARHVGLRESVAERPWSRPMSERRGLKVQGKDGQLRPVSIELKRVEVEGEAYMIAAVRDDGPMQALRDRLETQEALYRDLFEYAPVAYVLVGPDARIQACNKAACELMEIRDGTLFGTSVMDLHAPESESATIAADLWKETHRGTPLAGEELQIKTRAAHTRWVRLYTRPIVDGSRHQNVVRGALIDITAEKEWMAEKEAIISELQEALAKVNTLEGLLGVCAWCKKVRAGEEWLPLERFVGQKTSSKVTHGICPSCAQHIEDPAVAGLGVEEDE